MLVEPKSITPAFDRVIGRGLAFINLTVLSDFQFDEGLFIWLPGPSLFLGPHGFYFLLLYLHLIRRVRKADWTATFLITSIFTAPISSSKINGH
jgi:hypothetical protein